MDEYFDVVVIGGGHAACEAALAAARAGAQTLMLTLNLDHIAQMSCNPCIGGIAKGHLTREIDALGGAMGLIADASAIQFRMLNLAKGPAVWSPRAQCDKVEYQRAMKRYLEQAENLEIKQALVTGFLTQNDAVCGVETEFGDRFHAKAVVVATGTFLSGKLHYGLRSFPGGRAGDPPSAELAAAIREQLKLHVGRLKTGTPPRVLANSIDFSDMEFQASDTVEERFSYFPDETVRPCAEHKNLPCYLTHTNQETARIVRDNLDKAPMYNGLIKGIGTRYCPSFEDKVVRFPQHEQHHVYLEPEGEFTEEYYVNGLSTSLPPEIQIRLLKTIPGMEHVKVTRYAYAIEYDFVYPEELDRTMSVRKWKGLYHAGQINGTSGYEEAAAQGILAGINAARFVQGKPSVTLGRDQAYIGVLVDDLTTKGTNEPYRMMTSRCEYRLLLRQDNADFRLTEIGHAVGLASDERLARMRQKRALTEETVARLQKTWLPKSDALDRWLLAHGQQAAAGSVCAADLLRRPGIFYDDLAKIDPRYVRLPSAVSEQVNISLRYAGYIDKERRQVEAFRQAEDKLLPQGFDYMTLDGLRIEARQKLTAHQPRSLGEAGRISGVSPGDITVLMVWLAKREYAGASPAPAATL